MPDPEPARLRDLAASAPDNPFLTPEYAAARRAIGERVILLGSTEAHERASLAFLRRGWRGCMLRIDSVPPWPANSLVWPALLDYCATEAVTILAIDSFASSRTDLPAFENVNAARRTREEFTLALDSGGPDLSEQQRRNANRAHKAMLVARQSADPARVAIHADLMADSLGRHAARGETVPARVDQTGFEALVRCGAAEIHEALRGDTTVASMLVLRSASAGYYHSAGSTEAGREAGAATFLVIEAARSLAERGATLFHLGGASASESGLRRFKTGFGAEPRTLEALTAYLTPAPARRIASLWRRLAGER